MSKKTVTKCDGCGKEKEENLSGPGFAWLEVPTIGGTGQDYCPICRVKHENKDLADRLASGQAFR